MIIFLQGFLVANTLKSLTLGTSSLAGRNNRGKIVTYHKGGGSSHRYRLIDYKRQLFGIPAKVLRMEARSHCDSFLFLIAYANGTLAYMCVPTGVAIGDTLMAGSFAAIRNGNALPLKHIPIGTFIHNIELKPFAGAQLCRAAGSFAQLLRKSRNSALVRLRSGLIRRLPLLAMATIGVVWSKEPHLRYTFGLSKPIESVYSSSFLENAQIYHHNPKVRKNAGQSRRLGCRPVVRGTAMNPVDHPHGGKSRGRPSVSPWAFITKGQPTRTKRIKQITW